MAFIGYPIRLQTDGWLHRTESAADAIVQLLGVMVRTPQAGWYGSANFGLRDMLETLQTKPATRLTVIKQINQELQDLGLDWVKVSQIEEEVDSRTGNAAFLFTLVYANQGTQVHRIAKER